MIVASPPPLPVPADATSIVRVQGGGVQLYRCTAQAIGAAWVLARPAATLYDGDGATFGEHGAGPSWTARDGSSIVADGKAPLATFSPSTAVPWLVLRVVTHAGSGVFGDARYVERYDTAGGLAPSTGCTSADVGALHAVHYSAVYEFFR